MNILFTVKSIEGDGVKVHSKIECAFRLLGRFIVNDIPESLDYHNASL